MQTEIPVDLKIMISNKLGIKAQDSGLLNHRFSIHFWHYLIKCSGDVNWKELITDAHFKMLGYGFSELKGSEDNYSSPLFYVGYDMTKSIMRLLKAPFESLNAPIYVSQQDCKSSKKEFYAYLTSIDASQVSSPITLSTGATVNILIINNYDKANPQLKNHITEITKYNKSCMVFLCAELPPLSEIMNSDCKPVEMDSNGEIIQLMTPSVVEKLNVAVGA